MSKRVRIGAACVALLGAVTASALFAVSSQQSSLKQQQISKVRALVKGGKYRATPTPVRSEKLPEGREGAGAAQEAYDNRAYPATRIAYAQVAKAQQAAQKISAKKPSKPPKGSTGWEFRGPEGLSVHPLGTQTYGAPTEWSGRVTALGVGPCTEKGACTLYVGAAGGGVWKTKNGNATNPSWTQVSDNADPAKGIPSNAIGSLLVDPSDPSKKTIWVGTGEPNGSGDSEAGIGLYKSIDAGKTWSLIPASVAISKDRSIGSIAVDPNDNQHILIGTDVARHGSSAHNGGRFTPPGAPDVGLYESFDGGATWNLAFSETADTVDPSSPTGSDYFLGGVTKIEFDPTEEGTFYFSMFGYGLFRYAGSYENIFFDDESPSAASVDVVRFEFDAVDIAAFCTAPNAACPAPVRAALIKHGTPKVGSGCTLIYLGAGWNEGGPHGAARLYGSACVNFANASDLTTGGTNGGWEDLSSDEITDPGYTSYDWCQGQCSYDAFVATQPNRPWDVFLGGSMQYGEIPTFGGISNGRGVVQSTNWGSSFTDMTADFTPRAGAFFYPYEAMHPDQHVIAFNPAKPDIFYVGSDGGMIRSNGKYRNASSDCTTNPNRGISGDDLAFCEYVLSSVPEKLQTMNKGLGTLQFQSLSVDPAKPLTSLLGGTQDNGTPAYQNNQMWFLGMTGDGGASGTDAVNSNIRFHSYYSLYAGDTNFQGVDPLHWLWTSDPIVFAVALGGEGISFYPPQIDDPVTGGQRFIGTNHVWRTQDNGGDQTFLEANCNTVFGTQLFSGDCGDWQELGSFGLDDSNYGADKLPNDPANNYVVRLTRAPSDTSTLWAGLRRGRVFISKNADAADPADVEFLRIDTPAEPERFVSGIYVSKTNPYQAYVTYSGYNAYATAAGTAPGHIFSVTVDPNDCDATSCAATWTNLDADIGDQPILDVAYDKCAGTLYVSTDWGVNKFSGLGWVPAASGLPPVAVYGLTLAKVSPTQQVLWAATHGRGAYRLVLPNC